MERDPTSRRQGYTAKSYQKALSECLLPVYDATHEFQQDNARIHNFGGTPEWLQIHGIEYIYWPPHSPDLNPIEHIWKALKGKLLELFPGLYFLTNNKASIEKLKEYLKIAWNSIPRDLIRRLIESLPRRLAAVIRTRGYYTNY